MTEPNLDFVGRTHPLYCDECDERIPQDEWLSTTRVSWHYSPDRATTVPQTGPTPPTIPQEAHQIWSQREIIDEDQRGYKKTKFTVYFHFPEESD